MSALITTAVDIVARTVNVEYFKTISTSRWGDRGTGWDRERTGESVDDIIP